MKFVFIGIYLCVLLADSTSVESLMNILSVKVLEMALGILGKCSNKKQRPSDKIFSQVGFNLDRLFRNYQSGHAPYSILTGEFFFPRIAHKIKIVKPALLSQMIFWT